MNSDGTLTPEQVNAYSDNGFVIVRNLFDRRRMEAIKATAQDSIRNRHPEDSSGVPVFFIDTIPSPFLDVCCCPELTTIVRQLLGSAIEFLSVKPVYKNASITFPSDWHQDYAYWHGSHKLSVWIALDDATPENGCLRFIPGAHKKFLPHNHKEGTFAKYLNDDQLDLSRAVDAPMLAGDACFFIDLAPHASYGNTSGEDRWSFIPTYRSATVPDSSEVWAESIQL